jgi:hypothetical protein
MDSHQAADRIGVRRGRQADTEKKGSNFLGGDPGNSLFHFLKKGGAGVAPRAWAHNLGEILLSAIDRRLRLRRLRHSRPAGE